MMNMAIDETMAEVQEVITQKTGGAPATGGDQGGNKGTKSI